MLIGLDCRKILHPEKGEAAGVGHYIHHLLPHLLEEGTHDQFVLFFDDREAAEAKREFLRGHPRATIRMLPFASLRRHVPFVYAHMIISAVFNREKLDILHGPANVTPLFYRGRTVVTVHDLAIYDHPEWFPGVLPGVQTFSKRITVPHSLRHAARVIAVSASTKRDIMRNFSLEEEKIDVVHEGVTCVLGGQRTADSGQRSTQLADGRPPFTNAALSRYGLREGKYILSLSTIEPRKNIPGLVRAFVRSASEGNIPAEIDLIFAGAKGWKCDQSLRAIDDANRMLGSKRVRWIGYVSDEEKSFVIAGAALFVYPSFYEGFGLPPLEAMALGVPVISSSVSSLPEVCGDAAILVDPKDTDGLAAAMAQVFADPIAAAELVEKGRKQAEKFSWQKAAHETLACYRKSLGTSTKVSSG